MINEETDMAKPNPFRVVADEGVDPELESSKSLIKQVLQDVIQKVDDEDIETLALVAITSEGCVVSARHVNKNYFMLLGAMEKQKYEVVQLLDQTNYTASEQEY